MPLTRANVTIAQRVMTVVNTGFAAALGYGFTFEADRLREAPAYKGVSHLLPLELQGIGYLGMATLLALGLIVHKRAIHVAGLAWMLAWTAALSAFLVIAWAQDYATFLAWTFPAYVACACWASMLSLQSRET